MAETPPKKERIIFQPWFFRGQLAVKYQKSRGTSGLFAPSFLVASIAELAIQHLKRYVFWTNETTVFFQKWWPWGFNPPVAKLHHQVWKTIKSNGTVLRWFSCRKSTCCISFATNDTYISLNIPNCQHFLGIAAVIHNLLDIEVGVHLRRGDKLPMMPGLRAAWVNNFCWMGGCQVGVLEWIGMGRDVRPCGIHSGIN